MHWLLYSLDLHSFSIISSFQFAKMMRGDSSYTYKRKEKEIWCDTILITYETRDFSILTFEAFYTQWWTKTLQSPERNTILCWDLMTFKFSTTFLEMLNLTIGIILFKRTTVNNGSLLISAEQANLSTYHFIYENKKM